MKKFLKESTIHFLRIKKKLSSTFTCWQVVVMTVTNVTLKALSMLTGPAVRCANQIRKLSITVLFSRVNSGPGKLGYHRQHGYR